MEDVWLTGLLRESLGIIPVDLWWSRANSVKDLLMVKTSQSTERYMKDYITAIPFERDISQYSVIRYRF